VRAYEADGLAGLKKKQRTGRPPRLRWAQLDAVGLALRQPPVHFGIAANLRDGKVLAALVDHQFSIKLGVRECQGLFCRLGFRLCKPLSEIAHADHDLQRAHGNTASADCRSCVELWALDEVYFQQHGSRCLMWIPPEVRDPVSLHHPTRKQVGDF